MNGKHVALALGVFVLGVVVGVAASAPGSKVEK